MGQDTHGPFAPHGHVIPLRPFNIFVWAFYPTYTLRCGVKSPILFYLLYLDIYYSEKYVFI